MIEEVEQNVEAPVEDEIVEQPVEKEAPPSIREGLAAALEESKAKKASEQGKEPVKVAKEPKKEPKTAKSVENGQVRDQVKVLDEVKPPASFTGAVKANWSKLPPDIQQELIKRDQDFHKELTKHDEERSFGRKVNEIVSPYMATIRAEGSDAPQAIASLLNMAHVLRVGTPQQKSDLLLRTAQTYGIDLRQATQQAQNQLPPVIQQLMQEQQQLKSQLAEERALKKQQEDSSIQEQIKTFAAESGHEHFEIVKAHMASLLQSGLAKDLSDAYDQAVHANPQTRSTLVQSQDVEKRLANDKKAKAEAAKKAGSSLKGGPGPSVNKNGNIKQPDLRKALLSAWAEHRGEA